MNQVALVVGIETYLTSAAHPLKGPALDAMRFAIWLHISQKVPARNMIVCANTTERSEGAEKLEYKRVLSQLRKARIRVRQDCSHGAISKAWLEELKAFDEEATLWLYWSGHGLTFPESRDAVLCADIDAGEPSFIYLDELRSSLRSKGFSHFQEQRLIVDACAEYITPTDLGIVRFRNPDTWQVTEVPDQIELSAVAMGSSARADKDAGLFSKMLFAELGTSGWPDDLATFHMRLKAQIAKERRGNEFRPRLRTLSPYFAPEHASKAEAESKLKPAKFPTLIAQFQEENGEIKRFGKGRLKSLSMELWVENAPADTKKVFFEIPDAKVKDNKWKKKRAKGPRPFLTDRHLNAWGDLPVWARGSMKSNEDWTIRSTLYEALLKYYGTSNQSREIRKALKQMRDN